MKKKLAIMLAMVMLLNVSGTSAYAGEEKAPVTEMEQTTETQKTNESEETTETQKTDESEETTETQKTDESKETTETQKVGESEKTTETQKTDESGKAMETQKTDGIEETTETQKVGESEKTTETQKTDESETKADTDKEAVEPGETSKKADSVTEDTEEEYNEEDTLKEWLFGDIDTLPDDPEYQKKLEEGRELINDPALLSFQYNGYQHNDRFANCTIRNGIDVSYYQGTIDWNAVKNSGIEYVFVRVGYRGYSNGTLQVDPKVAENLRGANNAGLKVGAYIFSQAITEQEAREEAQFALNQIAGYNITMPIVIDYEYVSNGTGRLYLAYLSREQATANVNAFCSYVKNAGYEPMVYANKSMLQSSMNAGNIPYKVWLANYTNSTSYQGDYEFWQYTSGGYVNGINGRVDCDFWYDAGESKNYSRTIEDGYYSIKSALGSGFMLGISGGSDRNGADLQLTTSRQYFKVTYLGDGKYSIMADCSGKYVDAEGQGATEGVNVSQYEWKNGENQKWYIEDAGNGYYSILSAASELSMDVKNASAANGATIQLWKSNGGNNQLFKFEKQVVHEKTIDDGVYKIESLLGSGMLLDVNGASCDNGANIQLWNGSQEFKLAYLGEGKYSIMAMCSGKYVEAVGGGMSAGANVRQNEWTGGENQKWYIQDYGNGSYAIRSAASELCLDVWGGSAKNGANIQLWDATDGRNQKFKFIKHEYKQTIDNGVYKIESALGSGMLLDVDCASPYDEANVQLWKGSQTFKVTYLGNGKYSLMAACSGRYLDAACGGITAGTNVIQFGWNGGENQKWYIEDAGNGYFYIRSSASQLCLDVWGGTAKNGANIQLWNANGGNNQKFRFKQVTRSKTIAEGTYMIESALDSNMVLDIDKASKSNCANLQLWKGSQKFEVKYLGNGMYSIMAKCSGKYLDAEAGGTIAGTNVIQYAGNGGENQKWYIEDAGNGYYYIRSASSLLCLDVWAGKAQNGANLQLWGGNGGNNQRYKFVKAK